MTFEERMTEAGERFAEKHKAQLARVGTALGIAFGHSYWNSKHKRFRWPWGQNLAMRGAAHLLRHANADESVELFFDLSPSPDGYDHDPVLVPIVDVIWDSSKLRRGSPERAWQYMQEAALGIRKRRAPIDVRVGSLDNASGLLYYVVDGKSTMAALAEHCPHWEKVPVHIVP